MKKIIRVISVMWNSVSAVGIVVLALGVFLMVLKVLQPFSSVVAVVVVTGLTLLACDSKTNALLVSCGLLFYAASWFLVSHFGPAAVIMTIAGMLIWLTGVCRSISNTLRLAWACYR